jgi:uncharacterized protein
VIAAPIDTVPGVPATFRWLGTPVTAGLAGDVLTIEAGPRTDWFVDPATLRETLDAPALVCALTGDFRFAARVRASFSTTFDAGALVLWHDARTWAKLAFEFSPQGKPLVVSVVTRGESDDCNSMAVTHGSVWLRVARLGAVYAFHASLDGRTWQFVRHFRLGHDTQPEVGFEAQSPLGQGCSTSFSEISYSAETLADLRNGD